MTAVLAWRPGHRLWTKRRARWFLVALNTPFIVISPFETITGVEHSRPWSPLLVVPIGLALGALQLRHSFAAASGERPAAWPWTLLAMAAGVYLPMFWFGWNWAATEILFFASVAMLLRGWLRVVGAGVPLLVTILLLVFALDSQHSTPAQITYGAIDYLIDFALYPAALYGATRLVLVADELYEARAEQAEGAVGRERLRVSRDLHDLLGQSLSAISLKGDLALRLLPVDSERARSEMESLTEVARTALHDVMTITRDEHQVSLHEEIDAAAALLTAAGIDVSLDADLPEPPAHAQQVLAWAMREGTTNVLRHSDARRCSITLRAADPGIGLEITNDGARETDGQGTGLTGLAERAEAVSGTLQAGAASDGTFRLRVWIPGEVT
jgi:two-component system sensor histidine kinase DesK